MWQIQYAMVLKQVGACPIGTTEDPGYANKTSNSTFTTSSHTIKELRGRSVYFLQVEGF